MLLKGHIKDAEELLSYKYQLKGVVIRGNKMGRELGFPTANIDLFDKGKIIPQKGVYVVRVKTGGNVYNGMLYIGFRPTLFNWGELRIEVNMFDFSGDLYGKHIIVEFLNFLREDKKFEHVEDLIAQLKKDREISQLKFHISHLAL